MNSDGQKEENTLDSNLTSKVTSPSLVVSLTDHVEDFQWRDNRNIISKNSEDNLSEEVETKMGFQEPTLVDGALQTKLSTGLDSRTSLETNEGTMRPHQVDAVHPFFCNYRTVKFETSTSTDNQVFRCRQCDIAIKLDQQAVNQHFVTIQHTPIQENCVYCSTAVYEYFYNENVYYFHRCPSENQNLVEEKVGIQSSNENQVDQDSAASVSLTSTTRNPCCGPF